MISSTREAAIQYALDSRGESSAPIYAAAVAALRSRRASGSVIDVGCGMGRFRDAAGAMCSRYTGVDIVRHAGFPGDGEFVAANLDVEGVPLAAGTGDMVVALEVIEHLDRPRALLAELTRILRPGGCVVVSTPNQASVLSALSLVTRGHFAAFGPSEYPVHRTALLPIDLVRLARDAGLTEIELRYSEHGRIPLTRWHYPAAVSRLLPRPCSDNVLLVACKHA